jgi:hypothetical protein
MKIQSNWSPGSNAALHGVTCAKARIAFPLKIVNPTKWLKLRKQLLEDMPVGWTARRAAPYTDGSGALTFSCTDPKAFANLTPEWIERMTAKVLLISEG